MQKCSFGNLYLVGFFSIMVAKIRSVAIYSQHMYKSTGFSVFCQARDLSSVCNRRPNLCRKSLSGLIKTAG